jgi:hypothetical protein
MSHESGEAPTAIGAPPVLAPSADSHEGSRLSYCKPSTPVARQSRRRWTGKPSPATFLEEAVVWVAFTALVVLILGLACAMLWVVAP